MRSARIVLIVQRDDLVSRCCFRVGLGTGTIPGKYVAASFRREVLAPNRILNGVNRTASCLIVDTGTLYSGT